jgi:Replication initiator protein A (RepA) N-terminus.
MNNSINCISISDTSFSKIPNFLFTDARFEHISSDAKLLYAYMCNRKNLSEKNHWQDENGVYILFSREEMAKLLHCTRQKAGKVIGQLKSVGLVQEKRRGLTKANLIYVYEGKAEETPPPAELPESIQDEKPSSRWNKNERQDESKSTENKKDLNNNDLYNPSILPSTDNQTSSTKQKSDRWIEKAKEQIDYIRQIGDSLPEEIPRVDQLVDLIAYVFRTKQPFLRIRSENLPIEIVRQQFQRIDADCFAYVFLSWERQKNPIHYIRPYLLTALYNAPDTVDGFWMNEIANLFYKQNREKLTTDPSDH